MRWWVIFMMGIWAMAMQIHPSTPQHYRPRYDISKALPLTKGGYATARAWEPDSLAYASYFRIAELGGFEDIEGIDLAPFSHPIAYVWLAGFYKDERSSDPFVRWAYLHKEQVTLNPHYTPNGNDFYFDMCDERLQEKRAQYLIQKCHSLGLSGLFFDWANEEFLYEKGFEPLQETFKKRHPNQTYSSCIQRFFEWLKQNGLLIVTNQAYRNPEILQSVDYDMTESYLITDEKLSDGTLFTRYQPLDEVLEYFDILGELKRRYTPVGFKNFIYMNYAAPRIQTTSKGPLYIPPKEEILYSFVLAKMGGFIPYTEVPADHSLERTQLYFLDLGSPKGPMRRFTTGWYRLYEKGLLLLFDPSSDVSFFTIDGLPAGLWYDWDAGVWLQNENSLTIEVQPNYDPLTRQFHPKAKVLLYGE